MVRSLRYDIPGLTETDVIGTVVDKNVKFAFVGYAGRVVNTRRLRTTWLMGSMCPIRLH